MGERGLEPGRHVTLVDVLDRVLGKGAVIAGDVTIAVADVELIRLELRVTLGSTDAVRDLPIITAGLGGGR